MGAGVSIDDINLIVGLILGARTSQPDDRLVEDLGAESVDILNIIAALEEKYSIRIKDSEVKQGITSSDLFKIVSQKLAQKNR